MTIRVLLTDPDDLVRRQRADVLAEAADLEIVGTADGARATVLQVDRTTPDVVLLSSAFAGDLAQLCRDLRQSSARPPRLLLVDTSPDEDTLLRAVEAGVDGYVASGSAIADGARALVRGESVVPPAMLGSLLRRLIQGRRDEARASEVLARLTPREREVLGLLANGEDREGVAAQLVISPETARTHIQRVLGKLEVHSRREAVALATRSGIADRLEQLVERSAS